MIVAQERGIGFKDERGGDWEPYQSFGDLFEQMDASLGIDKAERSGSAYLRLLSAEGEAFRQRFIDYEPES